MDHAGRKKQLIGIVVLFIAVTFSSCYYDNFDELHPVANTVTCDSAATITYTKHIFPVLNLNCNSCHSKSSASGGVVLDNYSDTYTVAINGKLLGSVQHQKGYFPMPQTGTLDPCYIREIEKWVLAGAPNN